MEDDKYVCTLSPELQEKARVDLNEDPERRDQDIEAIREWIRKQPHLHVRTDAKFILMFLRTCKFSLERTKERIDKMYTIKTALPEWFRKRDPFDPIHQEALKEGFFIPLKGYDKQGRMVSISRTGVWDTNKVSVDALFRVNSMIGDILLEDEQAQICGAVGIQDLAHVKASQMTAFTPTATKKMMSYFQDCMPMRFKGFHYINMSPIFEKFFNFFKGFMKEKLQRRLVIHPNLEAVYEHIPKEILPEEYGGSGGKIDDIIEYWRQECMKRKDWFLKEDEYKVDESKRPGKPKTMEDLFGIDGSFRKLNVD